MKSLARALAGVVLALSICLPACADQLMTVRSSQNFEEAMSVLQGSIKQHGYRLSKVQRVDVGMEAKGYQTDKYRVVFFGRPDEVAQLARTHPELIPYLPLNVAIFSEASNTILTSLHPAVFKTFFPDPELQAVFERWESDVVDILEAVRLAR
jgi:uncharacterized protein (DUF302 family)